VARRTETQLHKHEPGDGLRITCKHRNFLDVVEFSITLTIEASPEIRHQNLCTLVEPHSTAFKHAFIPKARELVCQKVDQARC
jgi:hypothetical protein